MSLRRFCGWEPAEYTEHHPAHGDVPARSVTRREVEWDDAQRLWMLALSHYEASLCRKCGHDLHDTMDPDTNGGMAATRTWVADEPAECLCCVVLAKKEHEKADDKDNKVPLEAFVYTARLVPNWRYRPPTVNAG